VSARFANRRFAPSLLGTALVVIGVAVFTSLGSWQLSRAEEKRALQALYDAGRETTVTLHIENVDRLGRYQHVRARGRFLSERQVLLDNMPSASGRPGYRVLTPLELASGGIVLIDRGWVPMGDRRTLPNVAVSEEPRELSGRLDELPRPGLMLDDSAQGNDEETWPRLLNFPTHATIERALGFAVARRIVLLDPSEPDGFERAWDIRTQFGPERHIAYAVQWFAFAIVGVVIYLIVSLRKQET